MSQTLGVRTKNDPSFYLGLPNVVSRNKGEVFRYIKEKVWNRMQSWKGKIISQAGKEILLKAVIQSIPSYVMSVFLLPKGLCEDLEHLMNKFWWLSNVENMGGIRWMAWDRLCYPKKLGGMSFRRVRQFNIAMLRKQAWKMMTDPHSFIAKLLKARYFLSSSFIEAGIGSNPSFVWRSIISAKDLLCACSVLKIGNGDTINIWNDAWIPDLDNPRVSSVI